MWSEIEPRQYARRIDACELVRAFLVAYVLRLPGLRAVADHRARTLSHCAMSSLSFALRRASSLRMVRALVERASEQGRPWGRRDRIALDSMPLTLPDTYRHGCEPINAQAVGGGVLWAFNLRARRGTNPVRVLKFLRGAWHDSRAIRDVVLQPRGPLYLMDRGFYALDLIAQWVGEHVRFIIRAKRTHLTYTVEQELSSPRRLGPKVTLAVDAIVRLGGRHRKHHPRVRLVRVESGDDPLILVSSCLELSADEMLEAYRERWQIERFHRELKRNLGLAHLYSFQQSGLEFLTSVAVLLVLLLWNDIQTNNGKRFTVDLLREMFSALRRASGLYGPWIPNTHPRTPRGRRLNLSRKKRSNH